MASEAEIRGAERARLDGIIAELGTEGEQTQLLLSGVLWSGISLGQYLGEEPLGHLAPEPELLARLARRAERRARFGLPAVERGGDPPTHGCTCLEAALDEAGRGKRAVLRLAAGFHWSPPRRRERVLSEEVPPALREACAEPQETAELVEDPPPKPAPAPEPPFRVVKHFRRWYDDAERPGFSDMQF